MTINEDNIHPLQEKEKMTMLNLTSTNTSEVFLQWNIVPDKLTVNCWSEEFWNKPNAKSEKIPVKIDDSNSENPPIISIELKDVNYIYEVIGEWDSNENYGGIASYIFYTVKNHI